MNFSMLVIVIAFMRTAYVSVLHCVAVAGGWLQTAYVPWTITAVLLVVAVLLAVVCVYLIKKRTKIINDARTSQYRKTFDMMPVVCVRQKLIFDASGKLEDSVIMDVNKLFYTDFMPQLPPGTDVIGKKGSELECGFCDSLAMFTDEIKKRASFSMEYYHKHSDKYYHAIVMPEEENYIQDVFFNDITELRRTRDELRSANHKLALSLEISNVISWEYDIKGEMLHYDSRHVIINGKDKTNGNRESLEHYMDKIESSDRENILRLYNDMLGGKTDRLRGEFRLVNPSNKVSGYEWIDMHATVDKRSDDGRPLTLIGSSAVFTERKEQELALDKARRNAEESNRLKSAFLANMSHEIRTPLNAIVGFSNILASADDESEKAEYLKIIDNNSQLLMQLINDILDLSKIEAGTLEFVYSSFDLNAMLRELAQVALFKAEEKNLTVEVECGLDECVVYSDKNRLTQVLTNMINNAVKFTEKGGVTFGYKVSEDGNLYFYVRDTGSGIPAENLGSVFDRFVRLDKNVKGTGLGLSICSTIVEKLGGEIGVESEGGQGSTFWFTVPRSSGEEISEEQPSGEPVVEQPVAAKPKVLVADDTYSNYKLFEAMLKNDFEVMHADNGQQAVDMFSVSKPDIVLMDINMPVMNGYQALEEIRKLQGGDTVPVIAVTAYAFESDEQRILQNGFDAYVSKPVNGDVLKSKMNKLIATGVK